MPVSLQRLFLVPRRPLQFLLVLLGWATTLLHVFPALAQALTAKQQAAAYEQLQKTTTYGRDAKVGKYYTIRGFNMYCEVYGAGPPLLLIHGNGSSINAFAKQIPFFAKSYKVIVADSRAHGKSVNKIDSLSYEMMADDYAALLTALHVDSANVLGWSDGGINGLLLAIRHPEKVKQLVVTGANLQPDSTAIDPAVLKRVTKPHDMLAGWFKESRPKTPRDSMVYKYFRLLIEQPHISRSQLRRIAAPTLVIGGDHDVIRTRHTLLIAENIPKSYLWILPNSGHSTLIAYAEEFNQKVLQFLRTPYRTIVDREREF